MSFIVSEDPDDADSLADWLAFDDDLRGLAKVQPSAARSGAMGPPLDVVDLLLQKGGVATAAVSVALLWLRTRKSTVIVEIKHGKRTAKVTAQQIRELDAGQIGTLAREVARSLDEE